MSLDRGTVQSDFATAAQRHAGDRGDARMGREFQPTEHLLAAPAKSLNGVEIATFRRFQQSV